MVICDWCKRGNGATSMDTDLYFHGMKKDICYPCFNRILAMDFSEPIEDKEVATEISWEELAR